jgi:hypothetical protein
MAARINCTQSFHQCSGAVAQLGERLVRNEEATGSIPVSSTKIHYPVSPSSVADAPSSVPLDFAFII